MPYRPTCRPAIFAAAVHPVVEALEARRLLHGGHGAVEPIAGALAVHVNFQPAASATPAGTVADIGRAFGDRGDGLSYGWDRDNAPNVRDRNAAASPDDRFDTLTHLSAGGARRWEIAVPNGQYEVRVVAGDPSYVNENYALAVEGQPAIVGRTSAAARWIDRTVTATVTDGRLTIAPHAAAGGNKVAFVEVHQIGGSTAAPTPPPPSNPAPSNPSSGRSPFGSGPALVPGRIEAERFDRGGEGLAYHDADAANRGASRGAYREAGGVDLMPVAGGWAVGWVRAGEWLDYTLTVPEAGRYDVQFRLASGNAGGTFHADLNGANLTGPLAFSNTGGWENFKTVTRGDVALPAGVHVLRLKVDSSAVAGQDVGNIDWIQLNKRPVQTPTPPTTPTAPKTSAEQWPTQWAKLATAPVGRFEAHGFALGGKFYVVGGLSEWDVKGKYWHTSNESHVYDPAAGKWTRLKNTPAPETHAGVAVDEARGEVYFVGGEYGSLDEPGYGPENIAREVWKYVAKTDTWTPLPDLPARRISGGAALIGRNLHFFGGNPDDAETNVPDHWVMNLDNPAAGWVRRADFPLSRNHASAVALGGKIYAIGGEYGHDAAHDQKAFVHRYDPAADAWTRLADAPTAKSHAEANTFVWDGRIVFAGGQLKSTPTAMQPSSDEVALYDPATDKWSTLAPLPWKLQGSVIQKIGDKIYVSQGGLNGPGNPQKATWVGTLKK